MAENPNFNRSTSSGLSPHENVNVPPTHNSNNALPPTPPPLHLRNQNFVFPPSITPQINVNPPYFTVK